MLTILPGYARPLKTTVAVSTGGVAACPPPPPPPPPELPLLDDGAGAAGVAETCVEVAILLPNASVGTTTK